MENKQVKKEDMTEGMLVMSTEWGRCSEPMEIKMVDGIPMLDAEGELSDLAWGGESPDSWYKC